ncbi:MAG: lantibiotic dehydratase [Pseudonocardiaceae bacterium]
MLGLARRRVLTRQLQGPDASWPAWRSAMTALRERLLLPASVQVGGADRQLRLSLDEPMDLALLRAHLESAGEAVVISEAPTASDHGRFAGRSHEIVIPLAGTTPAAPALAIMTRTGVLSPVGCGHAVLPGSTVSFAKVHGHSEVLMTSGSARRCGRWPGRWG